SGMASIVVVSVLVVIVTLISIGFARIMNRTVSNAANRQASASATYAAQSAINDVAAYIKQYPLAYSNNCNGPNTLIGDKNAPGPFYYDSNLSGDSTRTTQYTCLILNQSPPDLQYSSIFADKPRVVKITTSAFSGALEKFLFSWQASTAGQTGYPTNCPTQTINTVQVCSSSPLNDETNWNSANGTCKDDGGVNRACIPILELSLYPVPTNGSLANVQADSKTVFLLPQKGIGTVQSVGYSNIPDGAMIPVKCTKTVSATDFALSVDPPLNACNIIFSALTTSTTPGISYFYATITPIYAPASVEIQANDRWKQKLTFVDTQALVDATATAGGVSKRLQVRLDTSSVNSATSEDDNIPSSTNDVPLAALRSANAICKRLVDTNSVFSYVSFDDPAGVCHDTDNPGGGITYCNQADQCNETLSLSINGVDSQTQTPTGQSTFTGVSYIGSGGSASLHWSSLNSTSCSAVTPSVPWGSTNNGWSGDQTSYMTFSGSDKTVGTGDRTFLGITSVTSYALRCSRVGGVTGTGQNTTTQSFTGPTRTVTVWPDPTVSFTSPPASVLAGSTFTLKWSDNNSSRCDFSGDWTDKSSTYPDGSAGTGSRDNKTTASDAGKTKTYTITCYDPSGRSASDTAKVKVIQLPDVKIDSVTLQSNGEDVKVKGEINNHGITGAMPYVSIGDTCDSGADADNPNSGKGNATFNSWNPESPAGPMAPVDNWTIETTSPAHTSGGSTSFSFSFCGSHNPYQFRQCVWWGGDISNWKDNHVCSSAYSLSSGGGSGGGGGGGGGGPPSCWITVSNDGANSAGVVGADCQPHDSKGNSFSYSATGYWCNFSCGWGNYSGSGSQYTFSTAAGTHWSNRSVTFTVRGCNADGCSSASATTSW
ncbi:MAG TPA: hypothetical protein VFP35_01470, partial [Candidatus Saccharimonadales bacterium]|nr:hypothetical protein [Candidatus Saccharimonadales bacterium]